MRINTILLPLVYYLQSVSAKCNLFKQNPRLRKIVKHYVHEKLFGDLPENLQSIVFRNHVFVESLIIKVMPPTSKAQITEEVESILSQFEGKNMIEENEFTSYVLSNSIWLK
jgi:hypothetical protein